jgi:hypothetical protein
MTPQPETEYWQSKIRNRRVGQKRIPRAIRSTALLVTIPGFPYAIQQPTLNEARSESDATRTSTGGQKLYNKEKTDNDGTADHDGHVNYVGLGL